MLIIAVVIGALVLGAVALASVLSRPATSPDQVGAHTVVFEIVQSADSTATTANVTHAVATERGQERGVTLPWRKTVPALGVAPRVSMTATAAGIASGITCRIIIDGQVVREQTARTMLDRCDLQADR
uniref:MmpS family transport accessory protein n=1 Tax=Herbidospora sakaeratensis TaxID=564415 RepID=UPI0007805CD7|nr:MmpS family transport accessory protein [Herbidospora sakaeratensis]